MRKRRLRPAYRPEELARIYARPHDDAVDGATHGDRIPRSIEVARKIVADLDPVTYCVADLTCGSAAIVNALDPPARILGDIGPGYALCGPIEQTIERIPPVDLFVCTETLEHIDDPIQLLDKIREKTDRLLLSTPVGPADDANPEHYWAWDREMVEWKLQVAGFDILLYEEVGPTAYYTFGVWGCA